jgi:hypothetical protein
MARAHSKHPMKRKLKRYTDPQKNSFKNGMIYIKIRVVTL